MRAKLLSLLALAAAATAGAATAQQTPATPATPAPPATPMYPTGPDGYYAAAAREERADRLIHEAARSASTPRPVFAVIGHHLVSGELKPSERLMALVDARQPTFSCAPAQRGAEIVLSCADGSRAQLKLDESGCGRSRSGEPASLCIGFAPKYAVRRLTAPAGETLRIDGERLVLEPVSRD